jgi:ATP-dependent helicase/nuclease subunit B
VPPPNVFTIAPERPFLATLARGLAALAGDDPLLLPRMTVLLPTRRAARSLREAFLRLTAEGAEAAPLLLPRLRPIGDLDDDEIGVGGADEATLAIPPAIPDLRRRLLLTRLVLGWSAAKDNTAMLPGQAAALAAALARLLDMAASEEASFDRLRELAPAEHAEHWQLVLDFLEMLPRLWPPILEAEGAIDPADRRNRLLRRQAKLWRETPPRAPVIAAGLMGGMPALSDLLSAVAWLDQGAVILPGLDRSASPEEWELITGEPSHPQHQMALLLRDLELAPDEVPDWQPQRDPGASARPSPPLFGLPPDPPPLAGESRVEAEARSRRLQLAAQALRPAALTDSWRDLAAESRDALAELSRYDCPSPQDEGATIALLLRRALETPGRTAALVTPDRELARRVAAELRRWDIEIDDSAGAPLGRTPPGVFLRLVLDLAVSALAPVPLLAALKHPLAAGGLARETFRDRARRLESAIRGPRPAPGFAGLRAALAGKDPHRLRRFVDRLETCLGRLAGLMEAEATPLAQLVSAHVEAAECLAATDKETGVARLWRNAAGEAAARFAHELIDAAADFPALPGRHYPALFEALASGTVVRPPYGRHPRLAIWGLMEARLQQADLLVLGGLNEGTWPGPAAYDPWMSRQMRREFGIALPERAIGIAAHDFAQGLAAPSVALTRAARREGVPTVPSRWLLRLDTVLRAVGLDGALGPEPDIAAAAALRGQPTHRRPAPPPEPRPPLAARPRRLSVTQIETWIRDPYAIYARHILRLKALDELDQDPGRADLGNAVHAALREFVKRYPSVLPLFPEDELLAIGNECFGPILSRPGVWAFWWPRFERVACWFVAEERARRADIVERFAECAGSVQVTTRAGPFTITAVADRIDRLRSGELILIDYKTGTLPSKQEIKDGIAVQLPLEGAIARDGSFGGLSGVPASLEHWRLSGGDPPASRVSATTDNPLELIDSTLEKIRALIDRFDDPRTPYSAVPDPRLAPRYSDYAHLERLGEAAAETGTGGAA